MLIITWHEYVPDAVVASMNVDDALSRTSCPYVVYVLMVDESICSTTTPVSSTKSRLQLKSPIAGPRKLCISNE